MSTAVLRLASDYGAFLIGVGVGLLAAGPVMYWLVSRYLCRRCHTKRRLGS